jgi:cobalt-zinc-cadmium efflux system outer membrane protein
MIARISRGWAVVAIAFLAMAAGCGSSKTNSHFDDVQRLVSDRTSARTSWNRTAEPDPAVTQFVRAALARELTADHAVQVALLNNMGLQATYQDLGIAQADLVQAGLLKNPTLSAERRFSGQAAEIDIVQDFLDILVLRMRKKVAAAQFEATKLRVAQETLNLAAETRTAFYTLQGAQQMEEMRRSVVDSTDAAADAARRIFEAGNTTALDLATQQKLAAAAKVELAQAELEVAQARERLNVLMGVWGDQIEWKVAQRLPDVVKEEAPLPGLEAHAIDQRLDLAAKRHEIEAAARSLGIAQTFRYIPVISIGAHYEHEIEPRHTVGPAIEVGVPLFDQGQAAVAHGQALLVQGQQRYVALAVEIRSQVRSAYARMNSARIRCEHYRREVLPLQQQVLDQTQLHYNAMQVGVFQLLAAKQAQIDAGREYIEALRDYWLARAELEKAIGGGRLTSADPATQPATQPATTQPAESPHQHHHGVQP